MVSLAFLLLAGALIVAISFALAWPLRSQRGLFAGVLVAVPLLALSLYQVVGTPAGLEPAQRETPRTLAAAIARLEADLARDPRQADGWRLLGRAYREEARAEDAREAFARAVRLTPDDVGAQLEYAEARAQADPRFHFDEEATAILESILRDDPGQERARLFLGIARRQAGRHAEAASTWEPLLDRLGPEAAEGLREQIDLAREAGGLPPLARPRRAPADAAAPVAAAGDGVRVHVELDAQFAARVRLDPAASVFVIARIPGGPPMPVAAQRRSVADLPLRLTLDDGDSPMPTQKLSEVSEVEILARISSSGSATPQEGDISSEAVRIALPADRTVRLVLGAEQ